MNSFKKTQFEVKKVYIKMFDSKGCWLKDEILRLTEPITLKTKGTSNEAIGKELEQLSICWLAFKDIVPTPNTRMIQLSVKVAWSRVIECMIIFKEDLSNDTRTRITKRKFN